MHRCLLFPTDSAPLTFLRFTFAIVSIFLVIINSNPASAARVAKESGNQVLLELEREGEVEEGDRFLLIANSKRVAVVEITKVRGLKAIGEILKGKARINATLAPLKRQGEQSESRAYAQIPQRKRKRFSLSNLTMGVLAGSGFDSQTVSIASESISMSGVGLSLRVFGDLPISGALGLIGRMGFEQLNVSGSATIGEVKTSIIYATTDLLLRYHFNIDDITPFAHGGLSIHAPLTTSSDVLDAQRVGMTTIFLLGGGLRFILTDTLYGVGLAEYGYFAPSSEVKTSLIALRAGLGFKF
jgi:hypothetical protein